MHDVELGNTRQCAMAMVANRSPLREILTYLVGQAERLSEKSVCSVLLLDKQGLLRNGASPGLPADYLDAIDRLKPDPAVGTCASAAATGKVVVTPDLRSDARWRELKHLPLALGFVAAWSVPIVSSGGKVLGTFGTYFRELRLPTARERTFVEGLAAIARQVIEDGRQLAGA